MATKYLKDDSTGCFTHISDENGDWVPIGPNCDKTVDMFMKCVSAQDVANKLKEDCEVVKDLIFSCISPDEFVSWLTGAGNWCSEIQVCSPLVDCEVVTNCVKQALGGGNGDDLCGLIGDCSPGSIVPPQELIEG